MAVGAAGRRLAVQAADIIFCCVGNDNDLRSVTIGPDGAFAGMKPARPDFGSQREISTEHCA